jgi:hypothetical protein
MALLACAAIVTRRLELALVAGLGLAGCTAILDPERLDDVYRCEFDGQCPVHADPRYANVCTTADETIDAPKICAPEPDVSCDPYDYDENSEFVALVRAVGQSDERYVSRCGELGPVQGCPAVFGECDPGLHEHPRSGMCDDEDSDTPPALAPVPTVSGQDVLDQFCRSTFCSEQFVCDTRHNTCVPCTMGDALGRGGCGDLYIEGQRSSVYLSADELADGCMGPDANDDNIAFGPL